MVLQSPYPKIWRKLNNTILGEKLRVYSVHSAETLVVYTGQDSWTSTERGLIRGARGLTRGARGLTRGVQSGSVPRLFGTGLPGTPGENVQTWPCNIRFILAWLSFSPRLLHGGP